MGKHKTIYKKSYKRTIFTLEAEEHKSINFLHMTILREKNKPERKWLTISNKIAAANIYN